MKSTSKRGPQAVIHLDKEPMKHALALSAFGAALMSVAVASAQPGGRGGPLAAGLEALRVSDYSAAEKALGGVTGADRPAALLGLARAMLEQGKFADGERIVSQAIVAGGATRDPALALQAEFLAAQGKVQDAIRLLDPEKAAPGAGGRRVRLVLGDLLLRAGRRVDAEPVLLKFADEYASDAISSSDAEGLAMVGRAMQLLRHVKDANRAYNESERAEIAASGGAIHSSQRVETLLWRASLFVENYDPGHAESVLDEAMQIAPHRADAKVMLARVKLEEAFDFDGAEKLAAEALAVDPKHVGAFAVRAGIGLRDMTLDRADAAIDAGLAVDPNDLELLSLRAAVRFLADDPRGFDAAKKAVLSRNKEYSRALVVVGEYAEWEHRYDDVIGMMKEAIALDPKDDKAWAQLGLMETRAGREADGVKSLQEAWKGDRFNVRVYNTLERLYGQWIPQQYDDGHAGVFDIRYPKDERALLERYVPRMLGEAWATMKTHYAFAPSTPVAVEMYREREHFSVRTSGLPNIGIEGVCFGHVVAAMSPNSDAFNWGNVLWHELAHVFAIQLSKNHVPRWFTEGLSEYETMIRRPEWQRELDPELFVALRRNALPSALDMNRAFTHAEGDLDVTVAYYAASQMVAFTAEQVGFPKITLALELWGKGKRTADVIREAFGLTPEDYDARFRAWERARLARYEGQYLFDLSPMTVDDARTAAQAAPHSASSHVALALALLHAHEAAEAAHEIDRALALDAKSADAHFVAAKLALLAKDTAAEEAHLNAIRAAGGDGYVVEMALADVARSSHDDAALRASLEAAKRFDPTQVEPLRGLYDLATADKQDGVALDLLRAIAQLDQHDRRVYGTLLDRLVAAKAWGEAKRVGEAAMFVDLENGAVHVAYARALSATGAHADAAYELESALLCGGNPQQMATAHALLAAESVTLGDLAAARSHRDEALKLDSGNADARALKL
jgi:tetratricopeptide (TPR) repeat protein